MKKLFIAAACALAFGGAAQAATLEFMYGLPIVQSTTEINQTGQLGKFDTALGTLSGAVLEIFGAGTTTITLTNNAATPVSGRARGSIFLGWGSGDAAIDAVLADDMEFTLETGANQSYDPGQSRSFGPLTDDETFLYNLGGAALAAVQMAGGGMFGINCASESSIQIIGGGGNLASDQQTTAGCGARIVYTFDQVITPVSAPGSIALLGLALLGLGATRRQRSV